MNSALYTFRTFTAPLLSGKGWRSSACAYATSPSSSRWLDRQIRDPFTKKAKLKGLKSRAAFKLLEINDKYKVLRKGQTVVDLGYAPGSWSQVAIANVSPGGRVVGVDMIPVMPPKGVSTFQGNFLSPSVQAQLREFLSDPNRGNLRELVVDTAYIELERQVAEDHTGEGSGKTVDVVLSDMCEPWELDSGGLHQQSLTAPYYRLMKTSGLPFRDHAGSMKLCDAALLFCLDTMKSGGNFVCKFYQGSEDKFLENRIKKVFSKVHREKPDSSRKESKEGYFVALGLKRGVSKATLDGMPTHAPGEQFDAKDGYEDDGDESDYRIRSEI